MNSVGPHLQTRTGILLHAGTNVVQKLLAKNLAAGSEAVSSRFTAHKHWMQVFGQGHSDWLATCAQQPVLQGRGSGTLMVPLLLSYPC